MPNKEAASAAAISATGTRAANASQSGFTLIELAVAMLIMGILAAVAIPSFSNWTKNAKVRTVAESVQNGIRATQTEALKRSRQTAFVLTTSAANASAQTATAAITSGSATSWYIYVLPLYSGETLTNPVVQVGTFSNKDFSGVSITGTAQICFNSMGRLVTNSATSSTGATCTAPTTTTKYDITLSGAQNPLEVQVSPGGQVRICDTTRTLSSTTPDGC